MRSIRESVLGRLSDLKYGDKARAIEIAEADNNYQQANRLRKQIIKLQDMESEIDSQIQKYSKLVTEQISDKCESI